ncbi:ribonuclease H-like domain-containing protein [Tanacetum coccineum]|uniref:Ribonuclease H-like domain-containing protein n=1 Tax=Tanacetum coccineum TaxID=301880 RepID=A0ABQ5GTM7_9ASTR
MNCHVTTTSPLPRSHVHALRDPHWKEAMLDEYNALISNGTWALVPRPANVNVVRSMWLFKHKFKADGSLSSPVVKPATIRTVLSLAVSRDWPIHQLERSLYGLKQAPRAWFQRFASYATRVGFQHSKTNSSLFVFHRGSDIAYLLLYVDDIILTASSLAFLQRIITSLHSEFAMTDIGSLNYFLGISAQRSVTGLFLSQSKFAPFQIIERIGPIAYRLELPQELSRIHDVFHVSNLKKCLSDDTLVIPLEEIQLDDKLNFVEEPVDFMDREVKQLKRSRIPIVKVRWNARRGSKYTWECKD